MWLCKLIGKYLRKSLADPGRSWNSGDPVHSRESCSSIMEGYVMPGVSYEDSCIWSPVCLYGVVVVLSFLMPSLETTQCPSCMYSLLEGLYFFQVMQHIP